MTNSKKKPTVVSRVLDKVQRTVLGPAEPDLDEEAKRLSDEDKRQGGGK